MSNPSAPSETTAAIVGIECEALFGHYSYNLQPAVAQHDTASPPLLLLYGDNGSGKTTKGLSFLGVKSADDSLILKGYKYTIYDILSIYYALVMSVFSYIW